MADVGEFIATLKIVFEGQGLKEASAQMETVKDKGSALDTVMDHMVVTFGDLMTYGGKLAKGLWSIAESAGESELVSKRLADAMKAQGIYTDAALESNLKYATSLQKITKYDDETIVSTMQLLTTFGLHGAELRKTTQASTDLASGLGIDLRSATMLLGKAFLGETSTLSRYGIVIDENIPKSQRFSEAVKQVQERFRDAAAGEAKTFTGQVEQLNNAFDDLKETIGNSIIPSLTKLIPRMNEAIKTAGELWRYLTAKPTGEDNMTNLINARIEAEIRGDKQRVALLDRAIEGLKKLADAEDRANDEIKKRSLGEKQAAEAAIVADKKVLEESEKHIRQAILDGQKKNKELEALGDKLVKECVEDAKRIEKEEVAAKQRAISKIQALISSYGTLLNNFSTYQSTIINNDLQDSLNAEQQKYDNKKAWIEANVADEEKKNAMLDTLEQEHADNQKRLQDDADARLEAEHKKLKPYLIAEAVANTAVGVTKAFAEGGMLGFITGALVAAAGAAQVAIINAQRFAKGVRNFGGGLALVGEEGPELVGLPAGSDVYTNGETKTMLAGAGGNMIFNITMYGADRKYADLVADRIVSKVNRNRKW
jgi:hypothetical protein